VSSKLCGPESNFENNNNYNSYYYPNNNYTSYYYPNYNFYNAHNDFDFHDFNNNFKALNDSCKLFKLSGSFSSSVER